MNRDAVKCLRCILTEAPGSAPGWGDGFISGFQTLKSILIFIKSIHAHGLNNPVVLHVLHFIIIENPTVFCPYWLSFSTPPWQPLSSLLLNNVLRLLVLEVSIRSVSTMENEDLALFFFF